MVSFARYPCASAGSMTRPHHSAVTANGGIETFGLDRKRAGIIVCFAMNQKNWRFDFVGIPERRHFRVYVGRFPERTALRLETERCERAVISAALGDGSMKQRRMGQQISRHKSAVTVPEHANAIAISDAHLNCFIDSGLRIHPQLLDICIVDRIGVADDRHSRIIQQREAM